MKRSAANGPDIIKARKAKAPSKAKKAEPVPGMNLKNTKAMSATSTGKTQAQPQQFAAQKPNAKIPTGKGGVGSYTPKVPNPFAKVSASAKGGVNYKRPAKKI